MVDDAFTKDDAIKTIVGEQAPPNVRRREELRGGGDPLKGNQYVGEETRVVGV